MKRFSLPATTRTTSDTPLTVKRWSGTIQVQTSELPEKPKMVKRWSTGGSMKRWSGRLQRQSTELTRVEPLKELGLLDLVEDVLLLILTDFCDIASLVAIGRTNKYLHGLAFTKEIWLSFVTRLVQRGFIDSHEDFEFLSKEQLISQVKSTLRGPRTWSHTPTHAHPSPPKNALLNAVTRFKKLVRRSSASTSLPESRRVVLHPHIATGPGIPFWENRAKLLPGGEYVLFQNSGKLECWSVAEDKLVWAHVPSMENATVLDFAAELTTGDQAVILTCQRTWTDERQNLIEITLLDLECGTSSLVLVGRAPNSSSDSAYNGCAVCGSFIAVDMVNDTRKLMVINWRTSSYVVLQTNAGPLSAFGSQMALIPDYIVLTLGSKNGEHLAISPLTALKKFWAPVDCVDLPSTHVWLEDLPNILADTLSLGDRTASHFTSSTRMSLWVYESPLRRGLFRVWLHVRTDSTAALCGYELLVEGSGASWRLLRSIRSPGNFPLGILYSGHIVVAGGWTGAKIIPPIRDYDAVIPGVLKLPGSSDFIHVSPYNGTVTYSTSNRIDIVYCD
ncbi:hypothetical protein C8R43DRAFT_274475 [Mycena crocata]|nr:hypothetical protein C8R43DRAFT_274475 [Mycena crocata]